MTLSVLGIIISLAFIVFLALRGFHIIIIAPAAVILVALFSNLDILKTLTGPYMTGFISYAGKFYLVFLAGSVFGKIMEDSGAARSISQGMLKVLGSNSAYKALLAVAFITIVLTYGGISLFVAIFAVLPIARPLFKELDIPWHLFMAAFIFGMGSITMTMLPGSPSIINIIPTKYMPSTPTSAPALGLLGAAILVAFNCWYMHDQLRRARARGEHYEAPSSAMIAADDAIPKRGLPNIWLSLVPPAAVIVLLNFVKLDIVFALFGGVIICAAMFWTYFDNKLQTLNKGALNTVVPIVNTCADVGYGMAIAATSGFKVVSEMLLTLGGHPIVSLAIATNIMAGITGSASGGLGIVMETLAPKYLALGLSPDLIHRIAAMSAGCFDAMPHNGVVITCLAVMGLTHANAYKHIWWGHVVATIIALVVVIPVGILLYR